MLAGLLSVNKRVGLHYIHFCDCRRWQQITSADSHHEKNWKRPARDELRL